MVAVDTAVLETEVADMLGTVAGVLDMMSLAPGCDEDPLFLLGLRMAKLPWSEWWC